MWRHQGLLEPLRRNWLKLILGGALMGVVCLPFRVYDQTPTPLSLLPLKFMTVWLQANLSWGMSLGLIGLALAKVQRLPAWVSHLSSASYWYYIAHLPLVLWLQLWVSTWQAPIAFKILFMLIVTLAILEATFRLIVRPNQLARLLIGHAPQQKPDPNGHDH